MLVIASIGLGLAGCVQMPTQAQIDAIDYGAPVEQTYAETTIKTLFNANIKDPASVNYLFAPIFRGYSVSSQSTGRKIIAGYMIDFFLHPAHKGDEYTPSQRYRAILKNNVLQTVYTVNPGKSTRKIIYTRKED